MNERKDPIADRDMDHTAFYKTLLFSSILFFFSGNFVLDGIYDEEDCLRKITLKQASVNYFVNDDYDNIYELILLIGMKMLSPNSFKNNSCAERPTVFDVSVSNYIYFGLPLILMSNFNLFGRIPFLANFGLTCDSMKKWGWKQWTFFVFLFGSFGVILEYFSREYYQLSPYRLLFYACQLLFIILFLVIYTATHPDKKFHMHHYSLMMILIIFIGVHSKFARVCLGLASAVYVEGVAHYNYDAIWEDECDMDKCGGYHERKNKKNFLKLSTEISAIEA
jgi:hypothetical protein